MADHHINTKIQQLMKKNIFGFQHKNKSSQWSMDMESAIDSSFFWGYLVTQIPGGFLASMFPANRIFGAAIFCSACLNMLVPLSIYFNPIILIMVRILQGLVEVYKVVFYSNPWNCFSIIFFFFGYI